MIVYGTDGLTARRQAYELLSQAAAEYWGLSELPPIHRAKGGKPYFFGAADHEFNLSHSGTLALCALNRSPVGVDIQTVSVRREGLARRVCSEQELAWLNQDGNRWERFAQLWALKECVVKYSGAGLTRPISKILVPLPDGENKLLRLDGLWIRAYHGVGWCAAACGCTPPPEKIRWIALDKLTAKS